MFMNPNEINKKYHSVTRNPVSGNHKFSTKLPFVDIPEESLSILRKVGDITRLIIMKDVLSEYLIWCFKGVSCFFLRDFAFLVPR